MEAILGVALVVIGTAGIVSVVVLALKNSSRADQLLAARDLIDGHIAENERLADDRDAEKAGRLKAEKERDDALALLKPTQAALAADAAKEADHAAAEVRNDPDSIDAVLHASERVPDDPAPATSAGDGHGGSGPVRAS